MGNLSATEGEAHGSREKYLVALSSVAAAILLTVMKITIGVATNSLGILSEAAHSGLDLVAAAVTLWAVQVSERPADQHHPYGHGKIENLSALFETFLLLVTCVWIIYESVHRLFFMTEVAVDANIWAFLVVVISIIVDYSRSQALSKAAQKYQSQALEADALHFSTDIWSSGVVLLGLVGVLLGKRLDMPWLIHADAVAALGVAMIVIGVSFRLGKKSIDDLLDGVSEDLREQATAAAAQVPGVESVKQVRLRRSGPEVFADVTLAVNHATAFEKTHAIADQAENAVRSIFPKADVVVHVEPVAGSEDDPLTIIRVLAARHGLGAHAIHIYDQQGQRWLELHVEVNESLTLEEAHRQATAFEEDVRQVIPGLDHIVTHLEPAGAASTTIPVAKAGQAEVRRAIDEFLTAHDLALQPHDVKVQATADGDELAVSFHCTLDAGTAITTAHDLTVQLEKHLRTRVPSVGRVVIHVEPAA